MSKQLPHDQHSQSNDDSDSKPADAQKTHQIKKNPRGLHKRIKDKNLNSEERSELTVHNSMRFVPQFGIFESEAQKYIRIDKFWKEEIDKYYRKEITTEEKQALRAIIQEKTPTLAELMTLPKEELQKERILFEELFKYFQLIIECNSQKYELVLIENQNQRFVGLFNQEKQLEKIIEISEEEMQILFQREKFLKNLHKRQQEYNQKFNDKQCISEISAEIAFLLHLLRESKKKLNDLLQVIYDRIENEQPQQEIEKVEDKYVTFLIKKNLKIALQNQKIDYLNYYKNLDDFDQIGEIALTQNHIKDRKDFQEYIKKKRSKKIRKNRGVLKSACAACLSSFSEQYNPFLFCAQCHVRFHKFCYVPSAEGLCDPCQQKKNNFSKTRNIECQFCPNKGFFLSTPMKMMGENTNIHIFCMLMNGLWRYQNGMLEFQSNHLEGFGQNHHDKNLSMTQINCCICASSVYTYKCARCLNHAHPLCAYLKGWNVDLDEQSRVILQCCGPNIDKEENQKRRKFILNFKRTVLKCDEK